MPCGGNNNLTPFGERSEEEQRRIRSAGGKASGKARLTKSIVRRRMIDMLSLPVAGAGELIMEEAGVPTSESSQMDAMLCGLMRKAQEGDFKAAALVLHLAGIGTEDPTQEKVLEAQAKKLRAEIAAADSKTHPEPITVTMTAEAEELSG